LTGSTGRGSESACVVVVTRAPGSRAAKTRLAQGVGDAACRRLQEAFLEDTLGWAGALGTRRVLSVHPARDAPEMAARAPGWTVVAQVESDFGERMRGAVNAGFAAGGGPVAMIATDSPTLPPERIEQAWHAVTGGGADVALAPAHDGGWVLIASRDPLPSGCFDGVRWSAAHTLADTRAALARHGRRTALLDPWYDVDTADDLERLAADLRAGAAGRLPRTSAALPPPA
jgi:uncharacterized protein